MANEAATKAILARLSEGDATDRVALRALIILMSADQKGVAPGEDAPDDPVRFVAIAARACMSDEGEAMIAAVGKFAEAVLVGKSDAGAVNQLVVLRDGYEAVRRTALAAVDISQGKMPPNRASRRRAQRNG